MFSSSKSHRLVRSPTTADKHTFIFLNTYILSIHISLRHRTNYLLITQLFVLESNLLPLVFQSGSLHCTNRLYPCKAQSTVPDRVANHVMSYSAVFTSLHLLSIVLTNGNTNYCDWIAPLTALLLTCSVQTPSWNCFVGVIRGLNVIINGYLTGM